MLLAAQTAGAFFLDESPSSNSRCLAQKCMDAYQDGKQDFNKFKRLPRSATESEMESYYRDVKKRCKNVDILKKCLEGLKDECLGDLYYHQNKRIPKTMKRKYHCSRAKKFLRRLKSKSSNSTVGVKQKSPKKENRSNLNKCVYNEAPQQEYKLCSFFGDQHLRTFGDGFQSCHMVGTYPLIDNENLVVMATSMMQPHSNATILSKITVLIKRQENCAEDKTYQASSGLPLPSNFKDGSRFGERGGVYIDEVAGNSHVEINIPYIATTLVIRKISDHLTFAAKMPREIVEGSDAFEQLCASGCPERMSSTNEANAHLRSVSTKGKTLNRFDEEAARKLCKRTLLSGIGYVGVESKEKGGNGYKEYLDPGTYTFNLLKESSFMRPAGAKVEIESLKMDSKMFKEKAPSKRSVAEEEEEDCDDKKFNFYFESCVFDLMATGDSNLSLASEAAFEDARLLHDLGGEAPGASIELIKKWPGEKSKCKPKFIRDNVNRVKFEKVSDGKSASSGINCSISLIAFCLLAFISVSLLDFEVEAQNESCIDERCSKNTKLYTALEKSEKNLANNRLFSKVNKVDCSHKHYFNSGLHT